MVSEGTNGKESFMEDKTVGEKEIETGSLRDFIDDNANIDDKVIVETITKERRERSIEDSYFLSVLKMWQREKKTERLLKLVFSSVIGVILIVQISILNFLVIQIGQGNLKFDEWTIRLFVTGVFAEIVALVKIIITNLFPQNGGKDFMDFLNNMFIKTKDHQ